MGFDLDLFQPKALMPQRGNLRQNLGAQLAFQAKKRAMRRRASAHAYTHDQRHGICAVQRQRSEEHTSELQSLMRISYAVFCLKKNNYITLLILLPSLYV